MEKKEKYDQLARMKNEIQSVSARTEDLVKNLEDHVKHYEDQLGFRFKESDVKQGEKLFEHLGAVCVNWRNQTCLKKLNFFRLDGKKNKRFE